MLLLNAVKNMYYPQEWFGSKLVCSVQDGIICLGLGCIQSI